MRISYIMAASIALAAVAYMASGVIGAGYQPQENKKTPTASVGARPAELFRVRTRPLQAVPRQSNLVFRGETEADHIIDIRAQTSGTIEKVLVEKGTQVKNGDPLFLLNSADRQAKLAETKATLRQRQLEAGAARNLNKKGYSSSMSVADADAKLALAQAELRSMEVEIGYLSVTSPGDGVIDDRAGETGKFVSVGENLAMLVDLDPLLVVGYASEREVIGLHIGQEAHIRFLNGEEREGKIQFISTSADPVTRTFKIEAAIANPDLSLRQGLSAEILVPTKTDFVHIVPSSALSLDANGQLGIKVVDDGGIARFLPAKIDGEDEKGLWLRDLPPALDLIVLGQEFVKAGDKVIAVPEGPPNP